MLLRINARAAVLQRTILSSPSLVVSSHNRVGNFLQYPQIATRSLSSAATASDKAKAAKKPTEATKSEEKVEQKSSKSKSEKDASQVKVDDKPKEENQEKVEESQQTKETKAASANTSAAKAPSKKEKNPETTPLQAIINLKTKKVKRNFDESLEFALNLVLDTKKQDQQLRVVADLPNGTGRKVKVVGFTSDPAQAQAALEAGCDVVGGDELVTELARTQQANFDKAVATPEMVASLSKVARLLGPRGLMPSKKLGTVVTDLAQAVQRAKAGSVELRADRAGVVHCGFGKLSMSDDALLENLKAVIMCIENNKPTGVKGKRWVKSAFISSSMGPSHPLNLVYIDPKNVRFMSKD